MDLVLARHVREHLQDLLDLAREEIDALDLHHIVRAALDRVDARETAAAGAVARQDAREVMRAEADERRALLAERRNDDLAPLAVRQILARLRVDDLQVHIVVPVVNAVMRVAADADARPVDLREPVDIVRLDAELLLDGTAHLLTPALRADDALAQVDAILDAARLDGLGEQQRIGTRRAEHRALHVHHHLQLLLRIARPHRHRHRAEPLAARLEADARRPEPVARCDLHAVAVRYARHLIAARELDGPVLDILRRIRNDDRLARRARGGMDAHDLLLGHAHEPERIRVAQILFLRKRQPPKILRRRHAVNPLLPQTMPVKTIRLQELGNPLIDECKLFL